MLVSDMTDNLIRDHLEKYLGPAMASSGATDRNTGDRAGVKICLFNNKPVSNAITLATVGLSRTIFHQPDKTPVRHEILFCARREFLSDELYARLFDIVDDQLSQDGSIAIGQLLDCGEPICDKSDLEAFVFYEPGYFDDGIFVYKGPDPPVVMAWAIPIHRKEMEFIEKNGAEAFDELLAKHDPDLLDLRRKPIVK